MPIRYTGSYKAQKVYSYTRVLQQIMSVIERQYGIRPRDMSLFVHDPLAKQPGERVAIRGTINWPFHVKQSATRED